MFFSQPKKADANKKTSEDSKSKLEHAISKNDFAGVKNILGKLSVEDKKVMLNAEFGNSRRNLLSQAIVNLPDNKETLALLTLLIENGANLAGRDPGEPESYLFCNTPLLNAIAEEKWGLVLFLIKQYDKTKHTDYINMKSLASNAKNSPLILALKKQITPIEVIQALLEKDANSNAQNHFGETALHYAAFMGDQNLINLLLKFHADINVRMNSGLSPYDLYEVNDKNLQEYADRQFIVADEKEGLPYFITDNRNLSDQYFPVIMHFAFPLNSIRPDGFMFKVHPGFPLLYIGVEFVHPRGTEHSQYPIHDYSQDMLQTLKPANDNTEKLFSRIQRYEQKCAQQASNVKTLKIYLKSDNEELNKLLDLFNGRIVHNDKLLFPQMFELRLALANCKSPEEARELVSDNDPMLKHLVPEIYEKIKQSLKEWEDVLQAKPPQNSQLVKRR